MQLFFHRDADRIDNGTNRVVHLIVQPISTLYKCEGEESNMHILYQSHRTTGTTYFYGANLVHNPMMCEQFV